MSDAYGCRYEYSGGVRCGRRSGEHGPVSPIAHRFVEVTSAEQPIRGSGEGYCKLCGYDAAQEIHTANRGQLAHRFVPHDADFDETTQIVLGRSAAEDQAAIDALKARDDVAGRDADTGFSTADLWAEIERRGYVVHVWRDHALVYPPQSFAKEIAEPGAVEIVTDPAQIREAFEREAADRLERPRFTAEQLRAVQQALWTMLPSMLGSAAIARAALSAIGDVEGRP